MKNDEHYGQKDSLSNKLSRLESEPAPAKAILLHRKKPGHQSVTVYQQVAQVTHKPGETYRFAPHQGYDQRQAGEAKNVVRVVPAIGHQVENVANRFVNQIGKEAGNQQGLDHSLFLSLKGQQAMLEQGYSDVSGNVHNQLEVKSIVWR